MSFFTWADDSTMLHLCMYVPACTLTEGEGSRKSLQKAGKRNINMAVLGI